MQHVYFRSRMKVKCKMRFSIPRRSPLLTGIAPPTLYTDEKTSDAAPGSSAVKHATRGVAPEKTVALRPSEGHDDRWEEVGTDEHVRRGPQQQHPFKHLTRLPAAPCPMRTTIELCCSANDIT